MKKPTNLAFVLLSLSVNLILLVSSSVFAQQVTDPKPQPETPATPRTEFSKTASRHCQDFFPGMLQSPLKKICGETQKKVESHGLRLAQTDCRLQYGEEPRALFACLVGTLIHHAKSTSDINLESAIVAQWKLCDLHYPQHTDVDGFLQESCFVGIFMPDLVPSLSQATNLNFTQRLDHCFNFSPERSFLGPCTVGLGLRESASTARVQLPVISRLNSSCEKFFDHRQFHLGYRSCLNGTGVETPTEKKAFEAATDCQKVIADPSNDNERAACFVGATLKTTQGKTESMKDAAPEALAKRFEICGKENKVSYQDRDFLACLTAASLLEHFEKTKAQDGCKDIFRLSKKNKSRSDCLTALNQF